LFDIPKDLIDLSSIETQEDIYFTINNLTFHDLSFTLGGNLIKFGSQMKNPLVIVNSIVTNIKGGSIHLEALNKQDLSTTAKMKLQNFTTQAINAEYGSLIVVKEGSELEIRDSHLK
jgi:hypothetical protein